MSSKPPKLKTQERLLISACQIFAEKGYQDTTIADICELAQTNIASVNYHFKDKKNLYLQTWRYAYEQELKRHPADGGLTENANAQQRLSGRIRSLIARITDPDSYAFAIMHKEMTLQSHLLEEIMEHEINPERLAMILLISELLGDAATPEQIQFCHASVISQCFHLLHIRHLKVSEATQEYMSGLNNADLYANHVITFSLAGINAIREQNHAK